MANNIIDHFNEYFEMIHANSDDLKNEAYKLRYQVFCIENEILNSEDYPDDMEFDDFDQQSVHYLIRHRKSGAYAATTRLILPDVNNPEKLFPSELHCEIDNEAVKRSINRRHLGEISRFCVSKAFKKRKNEEHTLVAIGSDRQDDFTLNERRTSPHIAIALMACVIKASHENDIHYAYATMEPSFFRFVSALGINAIKFGPPVHYLGYRWPALIKGRDLFKCRKEENRDIWNLLTNNGSFWQVRPRNASQPLSGARLETD